MSDAAPFFNRPHAGALSARLRRARDARCRARDARRAARRRAATRSDRTAASGPASLFTAGRISHAHWGVHVISLSDGDTLFGLDQAKFFIPASNEKIITTAVAAERLGWDYRFTTRILATSPISPDRHHQRRSDRRRRRRSVDQSAASGALAGLRRLGGGACTSAAFELVTGNLIADDDRFAEPGWGAGVVVGRSPVRLRRRGDGAAIQREPDRGHRRAGDGSRRAGHHRDVAGGQRRVHGQSRDDDRGGSESRIEHRTSAGHAVPGSARANRRRLGARSPSRPQSINATRFYATRWKPRCGATASSSPATPSTSTRCASRRGANTPSSYWWIARRRSSEIADVTNKWSRNGYAETLLLALAPAGRAGHHRCGTGGTARDARTAGASRTKSSRGTDRGCRATTRSRRAR